jgi:hypothetical protein
MQASVKVRQIAADPYTPYRSIDDLKRRYHVSYDVARKAKDQSIERMDESARGNYQIRLEQDAIVATLRATAKRYPQLLALIVRGNSGGTIARMFNVTPQRVHQLKREMQRLAKILCWNIVQVAQYAETGTLPRTKLEESQ